MMLENVFTCLIYVNLPFHIDFYKYILVGPLISGYILRKVH